MPGSRSGMTISVTMTDGIAPRIHRIEPRISAGGGLVFLLGFLFAADARGAGACAGWGF
jgi:hypothetical protein